MIFEYKYFNFSWLATLGGLMISTSVFKEVDIVIRKKSGVFLSKRLEELTGFENCIYDVLEDCKLSTVFTKYLGFSKSEFNRKLNEGAIYILVHEIKTKMSSDFNLDLGITTIFIKRLRINVWRLAYISKWYDKLFCRRGITLWN